MAGRVARSEQSQQPEDVLARIKNFVGSIVVDISCYRPPCVAIDRFRTYCSDPSGKCNCLSGVSSGREIITLEKESHVQRLDVLMRVLHIIQQLLKENKHVSKRDIYYMQPSVFQDQKVIDQAISDICILLKCSRHHLNVVPVAKGLVMGWLKFTESGRKTCCARNPNAAYSIPVSIEDVEGIVSVACYILVVEKETVFQRLANDRFCERNNCIVITGRGYPDVPTRRFLHHLVEQLHLPVYCLVDSDPYGFDILATYRFGSNQMAYDVTLMRVPEIHWIGALPSDFKKYQIPDRCLLQLTSKDKQRLEGLLARCYLQREAPDWRLELEIMLQKGVKYEIEALSATSFSFLSEEYIPSKIQASRHI